MLCIDLPATLVLTSALDLIFLQVRNLEEAVSTLPALRQEVADLEEQSQSLEHLQQRANELAARNEQLRIEVGME